MSFTGLALGSSSGIFSALDELLQEGAVVIDRPCDTQHPRYPELLYPVDYGYITGTVGGDGQGIDVFRGSARGSGIVGFFVTADLVKKDAEIKLLVDCGAPDIAGIDRLLGQMNLPHLYVPRT